MHDLVKMFNLLIFKIKKSKKLTVFVYFIKIKEKTSLRFSKVLSSIEYSD